MDHSALEKNEEGKEIKPSRVPLLAA